MNALPRFEIVRIRQRNELRIDPMLQIELPAKKSLRETGVIRLFPTTEAAKVEPAIAREESVDGEDDQDRERERQRSKNALETIAAFRHAREDTREESYDRAIGSNFLACRVISHHLQRRSLAVTRGTSVSLLRAQQYKEAVMKRLMVGVILVVLAANVSAQRLGGSGRQVPDPAAGDALAGLTAAQRADFADGLSDFIEVERVSDGLGPVFNERSCAACHSVPAVGGGSNRLVTRFATRTNGLFDALASLGGSLVQDHAIGLRDGVAHNFRPEVVPPAATIVVRRRTTPLFGLGLVDATPDSDFIAAAQQQAARGNGVAGRVNMVDNIRAGIKTVGKFGWKAQVPSLLQFSGDAYLNGMGMQTADFPNENCPQGNCAELAFNPAPGINDDGSGVRALTNYMSMLAPPPRGTITGDVTAGDATFDRIGCTACHVGTQRTGSSP